MDVTPLIKPGQQIIQSYVDGVFRISGQSYHHAVIVSPQQTMVWTDVQSVETLSMEDFLPLIVQSDEIDVVLLGTGATMKFFDPILKTELSAKGIVVDVMDTGAACRTYNVLMAEGRRVVAAMLPVI
ncbi:MAG: Mth938-like domain-containing protein [Alphaproteobacteria bacterium]|nr:Mth938-like domain-containing protein [Alphaproteobacteria bacterium]